ncbi:unnamed protein product, partial [Heterosigma akashiwo]
RGGRGGPGGLGLAGHRLHDLGRPRRERLGVGSRKWQPCVHRKIPTASVGPRCNFRYCRGAAAGAGPGGRGRGAARAAHLHPQGHPQRPILRRPQGNCAGIDRWTFKYFVLRISGWHVNGLADCWTDCGYRRKWVMPC